MPLISFLYLNLYSKRSIEQWEKTLRRPQKILLFKTNVLPLKTEMQNSDDLTLLVLH